ncbi:hypothetical protein [Burkholderia stabilis]|uniref:hypothetical protein n=1 Tax=Burkholderia stabilis TaxID=95485 RepID=UPI001591EF25|nr:hypothetical protein [Burkholderia stabilis]
MEIYAMLRQPSMTNSVDCGEQICHEGCAMVCRGWRHPATVAPERAPDGNLPMSSRSMPKPGSGASRTTAVDPSGNGRIAKVGGMSIADGRGRSSQHRLDRHARAGRGEQVSQLPGKYALHPPGRRNVSCLVRA